jgi:hypothetical protein
MRRFLEGRELIDAVSKKLGLSPRDEQAEEIVYQLFKKHWEQSNGSGDLQWNHPSAGTMHELALMVLELRERVAELESAQELSSRKPS